MRKYVIGLLVGFALAFSFSAYADDIKSLIGKTIQGEFTVTVDNKQLDKKALVIDGTSYLPVRAIGTAIGYDIGFDADLGITLNRSKLSAEAQKIQMAEAAAKAKKEEEDMQAAQQEKNQTTSKGVDQMSVTDTVYSPELINTKIRITNEFITLYRGSIQTAPDDPGVEQWKIELKKYEDELAVWEQRKTDLQPTPSPSPTPTP